MKKIGVIGVGIIASAVIEGLCTSKIGNDLHFYLSPRNKEKGELLKEKFPENITLCESNQAATDAADFMYLSVLPRLANDILSEINFRENQTIVSVISDVTYAQLQAWAAPAKRVFRMVPLPLVTTHEGPILLFPNDEEVSSVFSAVGEIVPLTTEDELTITTAISGMMSVHYQYLATITQAAADAGLSPQIAMDYTTIFHSALNKKARAIGIEGAKTLAVDEMTPGGLNDLSWNYNMDQGSYDILRESFMKIMRRLCPDQEYK